MKTKIKKLLSLILSMVMVLSITIGIDLSAYSADNANAKAVVDNICATTGYRPGVDNYNDCYAYASAFCNKMYGTAPGGTSGYTLTRPGNFYLVGQTTGTGVSASTLSSLLSQAMPGDVVQMKWYTNSALTSSSQHTAIVYSANSSSFTILQDGASWSTIQKSTYNYSSYYTRWKGSGFGISLYRYKDYSTKFSTSINENSPQGVVDIIDGGEGKIFVRGWAFDKDNLSSQLAIHVYIGGPSSDQGEGHAITANTYRADVNATYGCGEYHGYSSDIYTTKSGTQNVYVYAINIGSGSNQLLGQKTINITKDTTKPVITNFRVSNVSLNGYTVSFTATDNVIIDKVRCATWTIKNGQDDIEWQNVSAKADNKYSFTINKSKHNNETANYATHIYVYDLAGNYGFVGEETNLLSTVQKNCSHSYTSVVVKPTYYANGYTLYTCTICQKSYKDKTTNKLVLSKPTISLSAKSKGFKVSYKKITGATGYVIQYSTSSKFTSAKSVKTTALSKTVTKLTAKKKYYIRVRAYHTESGKGTVYSSWSSTKNVTTKK